MGRPTLPPPTLVDRDPADYDEEDIMAEISAPPDPAEVLANMNRGYDAPPLPGEHRAAGLAERMRRRQEAEQRHK